MINKIADYVLKTYKRELINGQQIAYQNHVFYVVDNWIIPNGKHYYDVLDNLSMRHYGLYE